MNLRRASFRRAPVLLLEEGHCLRRQALDVCHLAAATERRDFRATSLETLRQMVARPALSAYRTGTKGLYLCSASTPPGGGVTLTFCPAN